ncbi:uncharacterized protein EI90DRAFT_3075764 [Cantharellus anzutake]|uniref:uncharacterized protein n=1 Tax=Cantharellus anzutake TaxID=1750568 RepID=UPI001905C07D|nr:uncharacterized protein EI90DRAFT_3075764 [Cantharellus anzutake]KAF8324301.1 hypothetical protein EI90DRAFT_3075764 [Cantharellus anzutake]
MPQVTILKRSAEQGVQTQRKYFRKTAKGKIVKGRSPRIGLHGPLQSCSQSFVNVI